MSIEDIIMREELFDPNREMDFPFEKTEEKLKEVGIFMPEFRTFDTPDPIAVMKWDEETQLFYCEEPRLWFEKPYDLYQGIKAEGYDVDFDPSVLESGKVEGIPGMYDVESERKGFRTVMIGSVDTRALDFAHFYQWLQSAREWLTKRDDFMASYSFLSGHPAFWKRTRPEEYPNEWQTDDGVSTIWSYPSWRKDGSVVMMMETGSMVPPTRSHRYHDLRLDTYEDTYEKGIIATANVVHKFFDLDGSERPDVNYQKSELELLLEQRMAESTKAWEDSEVDNAEEV